MCDRSFCEPLEPRRLLATSGLNTVFFNNADFTGSTTTRIDQTAAFTWKGARPASGINATTFSVRWSGLVKPYTTETYTFIAKHNDGARVWVNGKLLINSWKSQPSTTHSGSIALKKNRLYDIRIEHFADSGGSNKMQIHWDSPSRTSSHIAPTRLFAYDTRSANIGDYGDNSSGEADVARLMKSWAPDFISTTGDNNYPSGEAETIDDNVGQYFHDYIGNYKGSYGAGAATNRFFPTLGNHDWDTDNASAYFNYFTLPGNERYYDFRRGSIHFFALDSDPHEADGITAGSKQGQWLKSKLQSSSAPFKVVLLHHPPYSSGHHGSTPEVRWPFADWGADVVLAGHDHVYERLHVNGIAYFVNGAGSEAEDFGDVRPESIVRNNSNVGAMLIQANNYAMTLQYLHRNGSVVDIYTIGA